MVNTFPKHDRDCFQVRSVVYCGKTKQIQLFSIMNVYCFYRLWRYCLRTISFFLSNVTRYILIWLLVSFFMMKNISVEFWKIKSNKYFNCPFHVIVFQMGQLRRLKTSKRVHEPTSPSIITLFVYVQLRNLIHIIFRLSDSL